MRKFKQSGMALICVLLCSSCAKDDLLYENIDCVSVRVFGKALIDEIKSIFGHAYGIYIKFQALVHHINLSSHALYAKYYKMIKVCMLMFISLLQLPLMGQERLEPVLVRTDDAFHINVVNNYAIESMGQVAYSCIVSPLNMPNFALMIFDKHLEVLWETNDVTSDVIIFSLIVGDKFCNDLKRLFNSAIFSACQHDSVIKGPENIVSFELVNPMGVAAMCYKGGDSNCKSLTDVLESIIISIMNFDMAKVVAHTNTIKNLTNIFDSLNWAIIQHDRFVYTPLPHNDIGFYFSVCPIVKPDSVSNNTKHDYKIEDLYNDIDKSFSEKVKGVVTVYHMEVFAPNTHEYVHDINEYDYDLPEIDE